MRRRPGSAFGSSSLQILHAPLPASGGRRIPIASRLHVQKEDHSRVLLQCLLPLGFLLPFMLVMLLSFVALFVIVFGIVLQSGLGAVWVPQGPGGQSGS